MRGHKKHIARIFSVILALVAISGGVSFVDNNTSLNIGSVINHVQNDEKNDERPDVPLAAQPEDLLMVHFIDVGQADCILAELPGDGTMMIDAGNRDDGGLIIDYIRRLGVNRIDILVGTHPHEDHIGGMAEIVDEMDIGDVYMPKVSHITYTFSNLLKALDKKGLKIKAAEAGVVIVPPGLRGPEPTADTGSDTRKDIRIEMLSPPKGAGYEDINDWSAAIRLEYGSVSFLCMGDAGFGPEKDMMAGNSQLISDVLKVAHHGSRYSTSADFLDKVMPDFSVIFVETGNEYGFPASETISKLSDRGVRILRTDEHGSIIFTTDGTNISVKTSR